MSAQAEAPHVIVVAGPNGAGKSTTAPALLKDSYTFHWRTIGKCSIVQEGRS
jgi:ABC-type Mn2+/Zn2+ transport system ATPase subunit